MRLISVLFICAGWFSIQATDYQEATLVNFRTVQSGSTCSSNGNINGQTDSSGNVTGSTNGTTNCRARMVRYYTIVCGEHTYTLRPEMTTGNKAAAAASLGYAVFFMKNSVLDKQLPGTQVLMRTDTKGAWVKLGKRESRFEIVEAR